MKKEKRSVLAAVIVLAVIFGIFAGLFIYAQPEKEEGTQPDVYAEYEKGKVTQILMENIWEDEVAEKAWRGEQTLLVEIQTGQYAGETLMVSNAVGPMYGEAAKFGQSIIVIISTYSNGDHTASLYEYNRTPIIFVILAVFALVTIVVGGKTGAKSILGLALTVGMLLMVFLPLLLKGWAPIPTAFFLCSLVAVGCFVILGGCTKKILCACLGTIAGVALAMLFGVTIQSLLHLDAMRADYAEPLLQIRQTGGAVQIRGLLVAGVIISALGAVMDVAMSIASALSEVKAVDPSLEAKALWKSGMNIGRDMVGTMTNTLILAIMGSGLTLIVYIYSLGLQPWQLLSSAYMSLEAISAVASSIGVMLAVPLTAAICAFAFGKK